MNFVSTFSGIEAASVAWEPLGWEPVAFAEIEPFPSAVLAHHFPTVPNLGDITKVDWSEYAGVDVLVGGSPCQSFSVAGLRKGLADPRGNLMLEYLRAVDLIRPRWVVWENVPGVLSADKGRAFGTFLGGLAELGYGFAYRVLDAQYVRVESHARAVPQRRRRVFVVGCLGDWRRAAAVLLERESLCGHPAPRREAGEGVADDATRGGASAGKDCYPHNLITTAAAFSAGQSKDAGSLGYQVGVSPTLRGAASGTNQVPTAIIPEVAHSADGFDASEDGTGRGTPLIAFTCKDSGQDCGEVSPTLRSMNDNGVPNGGGQVAIAQPVVFADVSRANKRQNGPGYTDSGCAFTLTAGDTPGVLEAVAIRGDATEKFSEGVCHTLRGCKTAGGTVDWVAEPYPVAFAENQRGELRTSDVAMSLSCAGGKPGSGYPAIQTGYAVRRLTPLECERLQGFPDGWTDVPYRGKKAADGPRYKAIGNSMAVNVMRFIGERIACVDTL